MASTTFMCPMCTFVKVERTSTGLDRVPYCDYCVIPMARFYGTTTN